MANTKKAETVKDTSTVSASNPTLSFEELIALLNAVRLPPTQRILATNLVTTFVATSDAATAMSAAAVAASEAATAVLNTANPALTDEPQGTAINDDLPELVSASSDSETSDSAAGISPYIIVCGNPSVDHTHTATAHAMRDSAITNFARHLEAVSADTAAVTAEVTACTAGSTSALACMASSASAGAEANETSATAPSGSAMDTPNVSAENPALSSQAGSSQASGPWYSVTVGRRVGVFPHWSIVSPLVTGVSNACFAKHATQAAAQRVFRMATAAGAVRVVKDGDN